MTEHQPIPVAGSQQTIDLVNNNKKMEEHILQMLDEYKMDPDIDQRWAAIGRTHIEQGFMAINRSIFKPERVKL